MVLNIRKRVVAGLMLPLVASAIVFAQDRGPVDFSLRSIDGQTVTANSLRGEVVVLAFGASWLPLSKTQLQGVRKLADEYADRHVVVYWVSTESEDAKSKNFASDEQLRAFAQKYGLKVTVLRDPDGVVSKKFGIDQLTSRETFPERQSAASTHRATSPASSLRGSTNCSNTISRRQLP
jgi:peroxiredoxin